MLIYPVRPGLCTDVLSAGLGGALEQAALLAKKALLQPLTSSNRKDLYRQGIEKYSM